MYFVSQVHKGVKGFVTEKETQKPIANATIMVDGICKSFENLKKFLFLEMVVILEIGLGCPI
jgi:hypothetical protein